MTKIEHLKAPMPVTKTISQIPIGTYFYGSIGTRINYQNRLFLRMYDRVFVVEEPTVCWESTTLEVKDFVAVEVTVKVEKVLI
jgi:hypothetical protein